jgi:FtsP/CotA-like multicopper oxidase with cupredoxin domain
MSGAAGAGALTAAVGGGLISGYAGAGERSRPATLREVRLEARALSWELAPGKVVKALAYNGQIPGPEIRLKEGERIRIVLQNRLTEPTTIHWHGVDVPNAMDGVPGITQEPVQPGETFSYELEARPAGTRWYHTHFQEHRQLDLGLAGPLIIEPVGSEPFAVDREYTLVLDDWATGSGPPVRSTAEGTAGASGGMTGMMGRGMMHQGMMSHGHAPAYDTMTINGKAYPATQPPPCGGASGFVSGSSTPARTTPM